LSRWHVRYSHITIGWLAFLGSLVALALFDPAVASGIARMSLVLIAFAGFALIVYLSTHGFDRAVLLIPTWFLLVVWVVAAGMTVAGSVTNDIVGPALLGGLVLIVMLIGFTVMQHAFAGGGMTTGIVSDIERRALALTGSGDLIWDWDVAADKVFTSPETEALLGLKRGTLEGPAAKWLKYCTRSIRTGSARRSTACWTSAAAGWCRISGCARRTATSCGSRSRPAQWSAPTARSRAWWAR